MSQRNVELFIGRLLTDSELRKRFDESAVNTLSSFCAQGWELTQGELDALMTTDVRLLCRAAAGVPSRLKRCNLRGDLSKDDE
ncbi:MAG TPA: Os1348 family NHLP clan protein [Polyangiaceae bacterium]|jgi:hypothetical protein|nr:Os1348 family NHLP clan protein [Polyangiaceae bacterium]